MARIALIMAAPAAPPSFSLPARYLPEDEAAKEWDRLAAAHNLHSVTTEWLKKHFARIELFSKLTSAEVSTLPQQIDLQGGEAKMDATAIMVETAKLRSVKDQLQQQLDAYATGGTAKEEVELDAPLPATDLANLIEHFRRVHNFSGRRNRRLQIR